MADLHPDIAAVLAGESDGCIVEGGCLDVMPAMPQRSVDLVFGSPPYEDRRTYGIDFALTGQAWADWMVKVVRASLRVCDGLVCFVVAGKTEGYRYSAVPEMLQADLHRAGVCLRRPPIFHRIGIAGSGGPDWWRNDYEICICATNGKRLPWSNNTATGHAPRWAPGGAMSHRVSNGARVNQWGHAIDSGATNVTKEGWKGSGRPRPSHRLCARPEAQGYRVPCVANPGNVIKCNVGGGQMGNPLAHKNEAPFPEQLAEAFVLSFCPPGGLVLDSFAGSGTTLAVAKRAGRRYIGVDIRESQVEIARARLRDTERPLFTETAE